MGFPQSISPPEKWAERPPRTASRTRSKSCRVSRIGQLALRRSPSLPRYPDSLAREIARCADLRGTDQRTRFFVQLCEFRSAAARRNCGSEVTRIQTTDCRLRSQLLPICYCLRISTVPIRALACGLALSVPPGSATPPSTKVTVGRSPVQTPAAVCRATRSVMSNNRTPPGF